METYLCNKWLVLAIIFLLPSSMICLLCCFWQARLFLVGNLSSFAVGQWLPRTLWAQGQGLPFPAPDPLLGGTLTPQR